MQTSYDVFLCMHLPQFLNHGSRMSRCGMRRFDKHMTADRPSNSSLHQENQQRLSQLMQEREKMDLSVFQSIHAVEPIVSDKIEPTVTIAASNTYTPWKTPSTLRF
jgi:hypothetical protein